MASGRSVDRCGASEPAKNAPPLGGAQSGPHGTGELRKPIPALWRLGCRTISGNIGSYSARATGPGRFTSRLLVPLLNSARFSLLFSADSCDGKAMAL